MLTEEQTQTKNYFPLMEPRTQKNCKICGSDITFKVQGDPDFCYTCERETSDSVKNAL